MKFIFKIKFIAFLKLPQLLYKHCFGSYINVRISIKLISLIAQTFYIYKEYMYLNKNSSTRNINKGYSSCQGIDKNYVEH